MVLCKRCHKVRREGEEHPKEKCYLIRVADRLAEPRGLHPRGHLLKRALVERLEMALERFVPVAQALEAKHALSPGVRSLVQIGRTVLDEGEWDSEGLVVDEEQMEALHAGIADAGGITTEDLAADGIDWNDRSQWRPVRLDASASEVVEAEEQDTNLRLPNTPDELRESVLDFLFQQTKQWWVFVTPAAGNVSMRVIAQACASAGVELIELDPKRLELPPALGPLYLASRKELSPHRVWELLQDHPAYGSVPPEYVAGLTTVFLPNPGDAFGLPMALNEWMEQSPSVYTEAKALREDIEGLDDEDGEVDLGTPNE